MSKFFVPTGGDIPHDSLSFIVTGMGRSGTKWLAKVLSASPDCHVVHEASGKFDARVYHRFFAGEHEEAVRYLKERRVLPHERYGEVNSYLRYCVPALREVFGAEFPIAGLVRDGKKTVQSLLAKGVYRREGRPPIPPPKQFKTPFEKACWYWVDTYQRLLDQSVPIWTLESLNSDYEYFRSLCNYLGIWVPEKLWKKHAGRRVHVLIQSTDPPDWTQEQETTFWRIAGDIQEYFYGTPG